MIEQRRVRRAVGLQGGLPVRGKHAYGFAARIDDAREPGGIRFHPRRRVVHRPVLPGAEPQRDGAQVLLAQAAHDLVEAAEVELALHRFDGVPVDRELDGVGVQGFELGPRAPHAVREGRGVIDLAAEDDERLAIHQQLVHAAGGLYDLRNRFILRHGQRQDGRQHEQSS